MKSLFARRYVKIYLLPDYTKTGKRKTAIKKNSLNPVFDEKFKFSVPINEVDKSILWISVWHKDIFKRNDFLGEISLPLNNDVLKNPDLRWFALQDRVRLIFQSGSGRTKAVSELISPRFQSLSKSMIIILYLQGQLCPRSKSFCFSIKPKSIKWWVLTYLKFWGLASFQSTNSSCREIHNDFIVWVCEFFRH